jgi:imidazolonepropionase-like amidohydrolase
LLISIDSPVIGSALHGLHLRGIVLPDDEERDLYVADGRITLEPLAAAETVVDGGWLVPGLVDVHTHPGAEHPGDRLDEVLLRQHGIQHRDAGVTLLRVPGRLPACRDGSARTTGSHGSLAPGPGLPCQAGSLPAGVGRSSWRRCRRRR